MAVLGIDLGTTNSVVATAGVDGVRTLSSTDDPRIPSVVSFHPNGEILVGAPARERRLIDAQNTVYSVKRLIGRPFRSPEVRRAQDRYAFELSASGSGGVLVKVRQDTYTLSEISAFVLRRVRGIAEEQLGEPCNRAVITVPANFNELQRSATKAAARVAGIEVLRILNEPTAAALAYGYGRGSQERIAVFDLGGGTFDMTILDLRGEVFEVIATAGDTYLGGDDVDSLIADKMVEAFLEHHRYDARQDRQAYERLRAAAEWAKCELSRENDVQLRVEELAYGPGGAPLDLAFALSREALERLTQPLLARTFDVCEDAMRLGGVRPAQLDNIVMVGGQTRMPLLRKMVSEYFGREPLMEMDPDLVVAQGAALQARSLVSTRKRPRKRSVSLGKVSLTRKSSANLLKPAVQPSVKAKPYAPTVKMKAAPPKSSPAVGVPVPRVPPKKKQTMLGVPARPVKDLPGPLRDALPQRARPAPPGKKPQPPAVPPPRDPLTRRDPSPLSADPLTTKVKPPPKRTPPLPPTPDAKAMEPLAEEKTVAVRIPSNFEDRPPPISELPPSPKKRRPPPLKPTPLVSVQAALPIGKPVIAPPIKPMAPIAVKSVRPPAKRAPDGFETKPTEVSFEDESTSVAINPDDFSFNDETEKRVLPDEAETRVRSPSSVPRPAPMQPREPPPRAAMPLAAAPPVINSPAAPAAVHSRPPAAPSRPPAAPFAALPDAKPSDGLPGFPSFPPPSSPPPSSLPSFSAELGQSESNFPPSPLLLDVTPLSLGVETVSGFCEQVILRNSPIPTEQKKVFVTASDNQTSVVVRVCQGESKLIEENQALGQLRLDGLRQAPRGQVRISVRFVIDPDGSLGVTAVDMSSGREQFIRIERIGGIGDGEIETLRQRQAEAYDGD